MFLISLCISRDDREQNNLYIQCVESSWDVGDYCEPPLGLPQALTKATWTTLGAWKNMCQHVLGSRCARSSEQDRQAGVGLRVPGSGVSALHRLVDTIGRRLELRLSDSPECIRKGGEVGERQRGERGARGARKAKAVSEDPCEIGKPRWNVGGVSDEHHRIPALRGIASRPFVRDRWDEALGLEEARPPESIQPGSGGRGSGARDCHGSQPCRVENGFYPPAWPQGGLEAAHRRESALFSWPLATSIQIGVDIYDKT